LAFERIINAMESLQPVNARAAMLQATAKFQDYQKTHPFPDPAVFQELFDAVRTSIDEYLRHLRLRLHENTASL
jgi:hypothetical protein